MGVSTAIILLVLLEIGTSGVHGDHFRGGAISWEPIEGNTQQVKLRYNMGFKHFVATYGHDKCNQTVLTSGDPLRTPGSLYCEECKTNGDNKRIRSMSWICADFDDSEMGDFDVGDREFNIDVPSGMSSFIVSYENQCWVRPLVSPNTASTCEGWKMMAEINLSQRLDGKGINHSPVTSPIPVQKFHRGCEYPLEIPVTDPDGDRTQCRYTDDSLGECNSKNGAVCGKTPGVTILDNCTLIFDTTGPAGYYAVRVMIEDLDEYGNVLSKVSLSFLLVVDYDSTTCKTPVIVSPPRVCKTIPAGSPFTQDIVAQAAHADLPIADILVVKLRGMTASALQPGPQSLQKFKTVSWTPTSQSLGKKTIKFSAVDSSGFQSQYENMYLNVVNTKPPKPLPDQSTPPPDGQVETGNRFVVKFNKDVTRPIHPAYITLVDKQSNDVVDTIDASNSEAVKFSERVIQFFLTIPDTGRGTKEYILKLGAGIGIENDMGCLFDSQSAEWTVFIFDSRQPATIAPPPMYTPPPPVIHDCRSETVEVPPPFSVKEGAECFVHLEQSVVTVAQNGISLPYKLCCPGHCGGGNPDPCAGTVCVAPPSGCSNDAQPPGECCSTWTCPPAPID